MSDNDPRIVDRAERNKATSFRDHASGPPVEQEAVTGRPNDLSGKVGNTTFGDRAKGVVGITSGADARNSTFGDRAAARSGPARKSVKKAEAEDKAVSSKATSGKRS